MYNGSVVAFLRRRSPLLFISHWRCSHVERDFLFPFGLHEAQAVEWWHHLPCFGAADGGADRRRRLRLLVTSRGCRDSRRSYLRVGAAFTLLQKADTM